MTTAAADTPQTLPPPGLGQRAAAGFGWLVAQMITERVVYSAGQVVLAWLLLEKDYKLIALTYTVTSFAAILQQAGLGQVLIQRHADFGRWSSTAFWLSLVLGLCAGGITAGAAPLIARFYNDESLVGLLLVGALNLPLSSIATVPEARLRAMMEFKRVALLGVFTVLATVSLTIALALRGMGAYSFILPGPIVATIRLPILWALTRPPVSLRPDLSGWWHLFVDSVPLLIANVAMMVTYQGGYVVLGRRFPGSDVVGIYYFALSLSDQATRLLVLNLSGVLFPALSTLQQDVDRQTAAFIRSIRALFLVGVPLIFLQAALAGPVFRLVFPNRWEPAIAVFIVLNVVMLGRMVWGPCEAMLLAQRRQRAYMALSLAYAAVFLLSAEAGAARGAAMGTAIAAAGTATLFGPVVFRLAIARGGGGWSDVWRDYRDPVLATLAAGVPVCAARLALPPTLAGDIAALVIVPPVFGGTYVLLARRFCRADVDDLASRIRALLPSSRAR